MGLKEKAKCEPIARTGRVQDWLDDPESRLAVSCTTYVVEDSMEGPDGIEASWRFVSHALRNAAGAAVHLSKLRPKGEDNGKGLVASGPVSFGKIYSKLNEILRRGGKFRNGAVTLHLDYTHPDAIEFVTAPRADFPWAKRCLNVDQNFLEKSPPELIAACLKAIGNGDLWLTKMMTDAKGARIYSNVCVAKGTLVDTTEGPVPIENLVGKPFTAVVNGKEYASSPRGAWSNGVKKVVKVLFEDGKSLVATPTHEVVLLPGHGEWTQKQPIALLKHGDKVATNNDANHAFTGSCSRVVDIVNAGEQEVYDCSIPGLGFFSANGLIVSNCLEVLLPHRGTCLLQHVNLGACKIDDLEGAFIEGMTQLCELHPRSGVGDTGEYLSPSVDKQIGLGVLGLANFLSIHGITYKEFGDALEAFLMDDPHPWAHYWTNTVAGKAVHAFYKGIDSAASIAREHGMERAFCIAPTASCSYRYLDTRGFTTAPEIAPPIDYVVDRDSETMGVERFEYGPVEIAEQVGWDAFFKVANGIVTLYQRTGLFHGYSMNHWSDLVVYNEDFLRSWLQSPQTSMYYALQVQAGTQAKDDVGVELGESLSDFFSLEENESCSLDGGFCAACAE